MQTSTDVLVEVCLDSAESAKAAQAGGAGRVELCANLIEGGTTPSAGLIATTRESIDIALQVMIRPRGGDFVYSALEREAMRRDIEQAKQLGADGVVFGLLLADGSVDAHATRELLESARPLNVTFHRAFDMTRDPIEALETLVDIGIDRILTSGQESSVLEGLDLIVDLVKRSGERIGILPGCGITPRNLTRIVQASGVREVHVVGTEIAISPMQYRNRNCFMGTELRSPEYERPVTSERAVRAFTDRLRR